MHKNIAELQISDLPEEFRNPDVIFLGTDCTTYSVAAISKHRRKNPATGNLDPISDKAKTADETNRHCKELIRELKPKIQIWENPVGAGKSTQFALLTQRMEQEGTPFRRLVFPRYAEESSALIRMYLGGAFGTKPSDVNAYAASAFYAVDRYASYKQDWLSPLFHLKE